MAQHKAPKQPSAKQLANQERFKRMVAAQRAGHTAPPAKKAKGGPKRRTIHLLDLLVPLKVTKEVIWGRTGTSSKDVRLTGALASFKSGGIKAAASEAGNILALETTGLHPHIGQAGKHTWDFRLVGENVLVGVGAKVTKATGVPKQMNRLLGAGQRMAFGDKRRLTILI